MQRLHFSCILPDLGPYTMEYQVSGTERPSRSKKNGVQLCASGVDKICQSSFEVTVKAVDGLFYIRIRLADGLGEVDE